MVPSRSDMAYGQQTLHGIGGLKGATDSSIVSMRSPFPDIFMCVCQLLIREASWRASFLEVLGDDFNPHIDIIIAVSQGIKRTRWANHQDYQPLYRDADTLIFRKASLQKAYYIGDLLGREARSLEVSALVKQQLDHSLASFLNRTS